MDYDLQILWGAPEPPKELSQSLHSLLLEAHDLPEPWYLGEVPWRPVVKAGRLLGLDLTPLTRLPLTSYSQIRTIWRKKRPDCLIT